MIKKLCLMFAAFTVGLFVSLSLQACADNDDNDPVTKNPIADTHKFDAWKQPGLEYEEENYQSGYEIFYRYDYRYNDNGWIIKKTMKKYQDNVLSYIVTWTYTYSDSGDIQYCTCDNEGSITTYTKKLYTR